MALPTMLCTRGCLSFLSISLRLDYTCMYPEAAEHYSLLNYMHVILYDEFTHILSHLTSSLLHDEVHPGEHRFNPSSATP